MTRIFLLTTCLTIAMGASSKELFADFEGAGYGKWKITGEAFGTAPAKRTVPGVQGDGLVNTCFGDDRTTGTLRSSNFKIRHKYITFLIGGGCKKNARLDLYVVGKKSVASATGADSEELLPAYFNVSKYKGETAYFKIVDEETGDWGHINVDHIVFTDVVPDPDVLECAILEPVIPVARRIHIDAPFLQLPVVWRETRMEPGVERFIIEDEKGEVLRYMNLKFPKPGEEPDCWYSVDLREFLGRDVVFRYESSDPDVLNRLELGEEEIVDPDAYDGQYRPRFHFSPRIGWMNDVNGTYYQDGLYHLFYQYNPIFNGVSTGFDMHWGHSVSKDLVHWEEWPVALYPNQAGSVFSGTALVLDKKIPGVNDDCPVPTPLLFFTATQPNSQHFATTADGGRTWQRFPGNPVVKTYAQGDRDPKVAWHEESQHFIMLVFAKDKDFDHENQKRGYTVFRSKNLIDWEKSGYIQHWMECPELIRIKSSTTDEDLWMLYGYYNGPLYFGEGQLNARSCYVLGRFDGITFEPVSEVRLANHGPEYYAGQTFVNQPEGRHIMMGWAKRAGFPLREKPEGPFNQCASVPLELTLRAVDGKDALIMYPAKEFDVLRENPVVKLGRTTVEEATKELKTLSTDGVYDVVLRIKAGSGSSLNVTVRGDKNRFVLAPKTGTLTYFVNGNAKQAQLNPEGTMEIRFLIDRSVSEVFWNEGEVPFCFGALHIDSDSILELGGDVKIEELTVYPMENIWK